MTIKQLAFDTQQHLQAQTGTPFKRSHIYELLAAGLGFNSYASLCTDHVFTQGSITCQRQAKHGESVGRRCLELDYPAETALQLAQALTAYLTEQDIGVTSSHCTAAPRPRCPESDRSAFGLGVEA